MEVDLSVFDQLAEAEGVDVPSPVGRMSLLRAAEEQFLDVMTALRASASYPIAEGEIEFSEHHIGNPVVYLIQSLSRPECSTIGSTDNPPQRIRDHNAGRGSYATRHLIPWRVVMWVVGFETREQALECEHRCQRYSSLFISPGRFRSLGDNKIVLTLVMLEYRERLPDVERPWIRPLNLRIVSGGYHMYEPTDYTAGLGVCPRCVNVYHQVALSSLCIARDRLLHPPPVPKPPPPKKKAKPLPPPQTLEELLEREAQQERERQREEQEKKKKDEEEEIRAETERRTAVVRTLQFRITTAPHEHPDLAAITDFVNPLPVGGRRVVEIPPPSNVSNRRRAAEILSSRDPSTRVARLAPKPP